MAGSCHFRRHPKGRRGDTYGQFKRHHRRPGGQRTVTEEIHRDYGIILTVGIYASNNTDETYTEMKCKLSEQAAKYPEILQIHGFYVDEMKKLVSFALIIDFRSERRLEIRDGLIEQMRKLYPAYDFAAILDSDFSD